MRIRRIKERYGATLIEVMISLFVVSCLLTVFADLISRYYTVIRYQEKKDRSIASMKMVLDMMAGELEESLKVYSPDTVGGKKSEVSFWRYDPELFDSKLSSRGGVMVRYYLDSGTLYREVQKSSDKIVTQAADEVAGFSIEKQHPFAYTLNLSLNESNRIYTLSRNICLKSGF
ncbi:MAG: type II secretion system protein J [Candidatus Xenobiia bacterium LiM19]